MVAACSPRQGLHPPAASKSPISPFLPACRGVHTARSGRSATMPADAMWTWPTAMAATSSALTRRCSRCPTALCSMSRLAETVQKRAPVYDKGQEEHYNPQLLPIRACAVRRAGGDVLGSGMLCGRRAPRQPSSAASPRCVRRCRHGRPQAMVQVIKPGTPSNAPPARRRVVLARRSPTSPRPQIQRRHAGFCCRQEQAMQTGSLAHQVDPQRSPKLMKELGYNKGYRYDHDYPDAFWPGVLPRRDGRPPPPRLLQAERARFRAGSDQAAGLLGFAPRAG